MAAFAGGIVRATRPGAAVALVISLLIAEGCGAPAAVRRTAASDPTPSVAALNSSAGEDGVPSLEGLLSQAWVYTKLDAGGFAPVESLDGYPSLYKTAWMLQLGHELGEGPILKNAPRAVSWLDQVIRNPKLSDELPTLETIALASSALMDLGSPPDRGLIEQRIETLRDRSMYRWKDGMSADWGATARASALLRLVGSAPPPDVADHVRDSLGPDTLARPEIGGEPANLLPLWEAADTLLPDGERMPLRNALAQRLETILSSTRDRGGVSLAVLSQIDGIAQANDIPVTIPGLNLTGQVGADGLVSVAPPPAEGDPQATAIALRLGWTPPAVLKETVRQSAGEDGWRRRNGIPDPESTYYGLAIAHDVGNASFDEAVARQLGTWLSSADSSLADTKGSRRLYFEIALAQDFRYRHSVQIPQSVVSVVDRLTQTEQDPYLAAIAVRLGSTASHDLVWSNVPASQGSIAESFWRWMSRRPPSQASQGESSCRLAIRLQDEQGTFRFSATSEPPDVLSTALGKRMCPNAISAAGSVADTFAFGAGYSFLPRGAIPTIVDLRTTYLGLFVSDSRMADAGVIP